VASLIVAKKKEKNQNPSKCLSSSLSKLWSMHTARGSALIKNGVAVACYPDGKTQGSQAEV
jgi:hypothetical protein